MRRIAAVLSLLAPLAGCREAPTPEPFELQASYTTPALNGGSVGYALFVEDIDGDSALDIAVRINDAGEWAVSFAIFELDHDTLALRTWIRDTENARDLWIGDVDEDGITEVAHGNHAGAFKIREPGTDDGYPVHWTDDVGQYLDYLTSGDTDHDGHGEYLLAMEASPAQLLIIEATGPDTYVHEATLPGDDEGYAEPSPPFLPDLDGDGRPELVFGRKTFRDVYIYRDRELLLSHDGVAVHGIGDIDGDGRDALIGLRGDRLQVLELDTATNQLRVLYDQPHDDFKAHAVDVDRDGVDEFLQRGPDWFRLAHLVDGELVVFFESPPLPESTTGVNRIILLPDTDGDGRAEFVVSQPPYIHFFEATTPTD
jgi:hypothetical protein